MDERYAADEAARQNQRRRELAEQFAKATGVTIDELADLLLPSLDITIADRVEIAVTNLLLAERQRIAKAFTDENMGGF